MHPGMLPPAFSTPLAPAVAFLKAHSIGSPIAKKISNTTANIGTVSLTPAGCVLTILSSEVDTLAKYAIVETGGKQYKVAPGDTIRVETLPGDVGDRIELTDVVMTSEDGVVSVGSPTLPDAKVNAEVIGVGRGKKIIVFKYKAKTRYRRRNGHRQPYTDLKILDIP